MLKKSDIIKFINDEIWIIAFSNKGESSQYRKGKIDALNTIKNYIENH